MKKILSLLLAAVMCFSLVACAEEKVSDIEVNGETVSVTDFLIEHLQEYISTEEFANREKEFAENFGTPETPFTVTRAIELKVDGLGESNMSIHYLLVKADWWYCTDDGNGNDNILIVVNYDTGEVLDQFMADESWLEDTESLDYWNYTMLNGCLVGTGYDGGVIVIDSETRTELSEKDIAKINEALQNAQKQETQSTEQASTQENSEQDAKQEDAQQSEAEPQEDTIEITLDNWQDYMEIKDCFSFAYLENQFGEAEKPLPYFCVALTLKEEFSSYLCYDFAVEYNADCCRKDIVYNYEDFTFEIKECEADTQLNETKFVRNGGLMSYMRSLSLHTDSVVDNKVEKEYTTIDAYEIYGYTDPPMSYGFFDNGDGTARISYYPVNIEITRIQGTFKKN